MLHREKHKCHVALVLIKIGHETKTVTLRSVRQMADSVIAEQSYNTRVTK